MIKHKLFGFCGLKGSGKNTAGDLTGLATLLLPDQIRPEFDRLSYGNALKDVVAAAFGWERRLLEGTTPDSREWREQEDAFWSPRLKETWGQPVTPRYALQRIGTEVFRAVVYKDFWTSVVERQIEQARAQADKLSVSSLITVEDCRFVNEFEVLLKYDATFVAIMGHPPEWYPDQIKQHWHNAFQYQPAHVQEIAKSQGVHESEWRWLDIMSDPRFESRIRFVKNVGTKDEFWKELEPIIMGEE
jgi:hypothetical protein